MPSVRARRVYSYIDLFRSIYKCNTYPFSWNVGLDYLSLARCLPRGIAPTASDREGASSGGFDVARIVRRLDVRARATSAATMATAMRATLAMPHPERLTTSRASGRAMRAMRAAARGERVVDVDRERLSRARGARRGREAVMRARRGEGAASRSDEGGEREGDDAEHESTMPEIEKRRSVKKNDTREAVSAQAANDRVEGKKKKKTLAAEAPTPETSEEDAEGDFIESVVMDAREEEFALKKKRMELIIEEKEWDLESPTSSEDEKMIKLVEYVNAVEAFKELCSSEVPNTVSDLLGQYVTVYHLDCEAEGYEEAMAFLGIDPDEEDDMDAWHLASASFDSEDIDDEDDDEDDDDMGEYTIEISYSRGDDYEPIKGLHCAQDIEGNWRWLEDDLGRPLSTKPFGAFVPKLMSVEHMLKVGLNVNSLHEEVDPIELLDFSGCKTWEDAFRVSKDASAALRHMQDDGWKVDTRSWCNEQEHLIVVKELVPLRTLSFAEGQLNDEDVPEDDTEA